MKKHIKFLINKYSVEDIESAFIDCYMTQKNLDVSLMLSDDKAYSDIKKYIEKNIPQLSDLYSLVNIFELLIPKKDKKLNGAFFTPYNITEWMLESCIECKGIPKVFDPSCGCGAFLLTSLKKLKEKFNITMRHGIENYIYGVDIAEYNIERCKKLMKLICLENKENIDGLQFNLFCHDSLDKSFIKKFECQFDVVIGNPPYVKFQDLDSNLRDCLYDNWATTKSGNFNLYFPFFEIGYFCLKKTGVLSYITPNNYFTSLSAIHLREFFVKRKLLLSIVDFSHYKVFDAQIYTCVTTISKSENNFFYYKRLNSVSDLHKLKWKGNTDEILFSDLNIKKWRLLSGSKKNNVKKIEDMKIKLKDIADIKVGIATCKDTVYLVDDSNDPDFLFKEYNGKHYKIERGITRDIRKIPELRTEEDIYDYRKKIIFPYKLVNEINIPYSEQELLLIYPECYKYLIAAKDELKTRDKGKKQYPTWFSYARNQGINSLGKKLLTPTFSDKPKFILDNSFQSLFCNGYGIFMKDNSPLPISILQKILNSSVMDYFIKNTSVAIQGGYSCYQKNFIESFGIPEFSEKELYFLELEQDLMEINKFLYKKYNLIMQI